MNILKLNTFGRTALKVTMIFECKESSIRIFSKKWESQKRKFYPPKSTKIYKMAGNFFSQFARGRVEKGLPKVFRMTDYKN